MTATPKAKRFPPPPPEFRQEFEAGGWERVEMLYGARTNVIRKWIHQTGARTRRAMRAAGGNTAVAVNVDRHAV